VKKVIELIRVSSRHQAKDGSVSIPSQRIANRRTAHIYGLEIVRTIELVDVSGTAVLRTPEMQELLTVIESPKIEGVVAREFSRIMRPDRFTDFVLFQIFQETKTTLYLPDGPIDWTTNSGWLAGTVRAAVAGLERREMLARSWATKEEKRRAGKHPNGQHLLPFGVGYDEARGWFYKPEAQQIKKAFRWVLSKNMSYNAMAKRLAVSGKGLVGMLRNSIYCGVRVIDKCSDRSTVGFRTTAKGRQCSRRQVMRNPNDIIRVRVIERPLVTEEEFNRAQKVMESRRRKHWPNDPDYKHRYIFRGFLRCSRCGSRLVSRDHNGNDYYSCNGHRYGNHCQARDQRREKLENTIEQLLAYEMIQHSFHEKIVAAWKQANIQKRNQTGALQSQLHDLEAERKRVLDLYKTARIDRKERTSRMQNIFRAVDACSEKLLREPSLNEVSIQALANLFAPFLEWKYFNQERKRNLLTSRVVALHVCDCRVDGISFLLDTCGHRHKSMVSSEKPITQFLCPLGCKTLHVRMPR